MDTIIENVVIAPPIDALREGLKAPEGKSFGSKGTKHSDKDEKAVAHGDGAQGFSPEDSSPIADSSESGGTSDSCSGGSLDPSPKPDAPQTEPASEKNPWSAWAWLGLCRTREDKNLGHKGASCNARIPNIVHVDVDAFFASVEQVLNPKLRGKPVLVGRGCVASASYEAKFRGVKTAMSFREALRICPQAIVVPGQYEH